MIPKFLQAPWWWAEGVCMQPSLQIDIFPHGTGSLPFLQPGHQPVPSPTPKPTPPSCGQRDAAGFGLLLADVLLDGCKGSSFNEGGEVDCSAQSGLGLLSIVHQTQVVMGRHNLSAGKCSLVWWSALELPVPALICCLTESHFMFLSPSVFFCSTFLPVWSSQWLVLKTATMIQMGTVFSRVGERGVYFCSRNLCTLCLRSVFLLQFWANNLCKTLSSL